LWIKKSPVAPEDCSLGNSPFLAASAKYGFMLQTNNSSTFIDFWFMNFILGLRVHLVAHAGELSMSGGVK
jgi:hypothetical protein